MLLNSLPSRVANPSIIVLDLPSTCYAVLVPTLIGMPRFIFSRYNFIKIETDSKKCT